MVAQQPRHLQSVVQVVQEPRCGVDVGVENQKRRGGKIKWVTTFLCFRVAAVRATAGGGLVFPGGFEVMLFSVVDRAALKFLSN